MENCLEVTKKAKYFFIKFLFWCFDKMPSSLELSNRLVPWFIGRFFRLKIKTFSYHHKVFWSFVFGWNSSCSEYFKGVFRKLYVSAAGQLCFHLFSPLVKIGKILARFWELWTTSMTMNFQLWQNLWSSRKLWGETLRNSKVGRRVSEKNQQSIVVTSRE